MVHGEEKKYAYFKSSPGQCASAVPVLCKYAGQCAFLQGILHPSSHVLLNETNFNNASYISCLMIIIQDSQYARQDSRPINQIIESELVAS